MAQYPANIDVSTLDGTNGFRMDGAAAGDASGGAVAMAGDVNGDGYADMVVGAPFADPNGSLSGSAYVVFGGPAGGSAALDLSTLDGADGFRLDGATSARLGISVSSAGDVNGDGIDDVIVGGFVADGDAAGSGAAYVVFGKTTGFDAVLPAASLDGANGFLIKGVTAGDQAGWSVDSAGDINGDGIGDLVVGAPRTAPGSSYVVFGHTGGFAAGGVDLASLDGSDGFRIDGVSPGDFNGYDVASAGDVNGDGISDLMVSSKEASPHGSLSGATYVVFGSAAPFAATFDLSSLDGSNGFRLDGAAVNDFSGTSIASAGDINGDGYDDLIVGAPSADPHGSYSGSAYIVFGKASGFSATLGLGGLSGADGFRIDGLNAGDNLGESVASAGDVNGDGFEDLILGANGVSYVVFGKASGFVPVFDLASLDGTNGFALSDPVPEAFGAAAASAGDLNGDGLADLIVGAYGASPNGAGSGSTYVIYGRLPDASVNRTGTAASQSLVGGDFADKLRGAQGDDLLWGHGEDDRLHGNKGDDTLNGGDGNDKLKADGGDDVLNGGAGRDVLTGGAGNDVFRFADGDSVGNDHDLIRDFASGQDLIDLHLMDADTGTPGDQAFHLVAGFSGAAGELIVTRIGPFTVVGGDVDGDGSADFLLVLSGHHVLTGADFVL